MISDLKKALDKIYSINMFSGNGWDEVSEKCGTIKNKSRVGAASDIELADGFIDFQDIWYYDNDVVYEELTEKQQNSIEEILLTRWSDYLLDD